MATVRHVRTPAGEKRYKQPIGSIIVGGSTLPNIQWVENLPYAHWNLVKGSNGRYYEVGYDDQTQSWVATGRGSWQNVYVEHARSESEAYQLLNDGIASGAFHGGNTVYGAQHPAEGSVAHEKTATALRKRHDALYKKYGPKGTEGYDKRLSTQLTQARVALKKDDHETAEHHISNVEMTLEARKQSAEAMAAHRAKIDANLAKRRAFVEDYRRRAEESRKQGQLSITPDSVLAAQTSLNNAVQGANGELVLVTNGKGGRRVKLNRLTIGKGVDKRGDAAKNYITSLIDHAKMSGWDVMVDANNLDLPDPLRNRLMKELKLRAVRPRADAGFSGTHVWRNPKRAGTAKKGAGSDVETKSVRMRLERALSRPRDNVYESLCIMLAPEPIDLVPFADHTAMPIGGIDGMHVTLFFGAKARDLEADGITLRKVLETIVTSLRSQYNGSTLPIGKTGKTIRFGTTSEGDDPIVLAVESSDVKKLRRRLKRDLAMIGVSDASRFPIYKPHMTLGYVDKDVETDLPDFGEKPLTFSTMRISWGDQCVELDLGKYTGQKDVYTGEGSIPRNNRKKPELIRRRRRLALMRRAKRMEEKVIRRVATPEGVAKYDQPIGSIIVRDGIKLGNISIDLDDPKPYPGWNRTKSNHGRSYDIGKDGDKFYAVAVGDDGESNWDNGIVIDGAASEEEALILLDKVVAKKDWDGKRPIKGSLSGGSAFDAGPARRAKKTDTNAKRGRSMRPMTDAERKKWGIPPNWTDVMWNDSRDESKPDSEYDGLIAMGKDAAGRDQPAYTLRWRALSGQKIQRESEHLQKHFKKVNARIRQDADAGIPEAQAMLISMVMGSRIGSERDTGGKEKAYGVSTLEARHVKLFANGSTGLDFVGKKGERNRPKTTDPQVRAVLEKVTAGKSSGDQIFPVNEHKMNDYLKTVMSDIGAAKPGDPNVTAHNFRHRIANAQAIKSLNQFEKRRYFWHNYYRTDPKTGQKVALKKKIKMPPETKVDFNKMVMAVATEVAAQLQNQPNQARTSYISHQMFDKYAHSEDWHKVDPRRWKPGQPLTSTGVLAEKGLFDGGNGIPRIHMPQLGEHGEAFCEAMKRLGIAAEATTIELASLQPSQIEFDDEKVRKMAANGVDDTPLYITRDNYILDGHHRWAAKIESEGEHALQPVIILDMDINAAVAAAKQFLGGRDAEG